jgi:uncharacterized protein (UPF0305 family)
MPGMSDTNGLSGADISFILTALETLKEDLVESLSNEATREAARFHIDLIFSIKEKIENREIQFSDDECRVMYIAALEMRNFMNKILDEKKASEYDREMAKSTLRSANAMLRFLRKTFIENGVDVDDLINPQV